MRFAVSALALLASTLTVTAALAADPPAATAPAATPPADAAAPPADPLAEPRDLVETGANTKENLKKAIALYEERLKTASAKDQCAGYADEGRAYLRLGDLETSDNAKLDAYGKGRAAAQKGVAADAKCAEGIYWDMANQAVIGRTKGVMNSLFMLGDLRKGLNRVMELQPGHKWAKQTLAKIDHAVPGFAGGSDDRAEKAFKEIITRDPHWTPVMAAMSEFYKDKGDKDEAKKWANKCLAETASSDMNNWRKFDKKDCQKVLKDLE